MNKQGFKKLIVWNKALTFIEILYGETKGFPAYEQYGLTAQLRRAATSIAMNIAEGSAFSSQTEFCRFLSISLRSTYEVLCGLEVAMKLEYLSHSQKDKLMGMCEERSKMIYALRKSFHQRSVKN